MVSQVCEVDLLFRMGCMPRLPDVSTRLPCALTCPLLTFVQEG